MAPIIVEEVIVRLGVSYTIHSDQGRQYESDPFKEVCNLLQIEKTHTTPYQPLSDVMVKRFTRTIDAMLSSCKSKLHRLRQAATLPHDGVQIGKTQYYWIHSNLSYAL